VVVVMFSMTMIMTTMMEAMVRRSGLSERSHRHEVQDLIIYQGYLATSASRPRQMSHYL
jgi:hypothetical protein